MTVAASMVVVRTERGDDMFMAWLERNAQQVLDLDGLALLPAQGAARPPALRPEPEDEGRHPPGPEQLWNESWYFDAVSDRRPGPLRAHRSRAERGHLPLHGLRVRARPAYGASAPA